MDGLSYLTTRRFITREICGRTLTFTVAVLAEHAEKEQYILSLKPSPLETLASLPASTPISVRTRIEETAIRIATKARFATRDEEAEFDNSLHGLAWGLWRALRDNHEEFGRIGPGSKSAPAYTSPAGNHYSIGPAEGVQRVLSLIEAGGNESLATLKAIRDGAEEADILPNSAGREVESPPATDDTGASPGPESSAVFPSGTAGVGTPLPA